MRGAGRERENPRTSRTVYTYYLTDPADNTLRQIFLLETILYSDYIRPVLHLTKLSLRFCRLPNVSQPIGGKCVIQIWVCLI